MSAKIDLETLEEKVSKMDEIFREYYDEVFRLNDNLKAAQERVSAVESSIERLENKTANKLDREVPGWRELVASRDDARHN